MWLSWALSPRINAKLRIFKQKSDTDINTDKADKPDRVPLNCLNQYKK